MKLGLAFLLLLFFLVLRGGERIHSASRYSTIFSPARFTGKSKLLKYEDANNGAQVAAVSNLDDRDYSITVENEDEDLVNARKYTILAKCQFAFVLASALSYFFSQIKSRQPFSRHLSYISSHKYILQRVLRI
jgi:hypothetical protein